MSSDDNYQDEQEKMTEQTLNRRVTESTVAEEVPFSPSVLFGILADTRQRYVLYYL